MSGDSQTSQPPPVMWAQRYNNILLTICLEDCKKPEIKINNDSVYFKGIGGSDKKEYEVTINLFKEIDPEKSIYAVRDRIIEFILQKKEEGPFWPHLTKEKVKYHWLKVDFNKWQEEDDSDLESFDKSDFDRESINSKFAARGLSGDKVDFDEIFDTDSDDGDLPNLE